MFTYPQDRMLALSGIICATKRTQRLAVEGKIVKGIDILLAKSILNHSPKSITELMDNKISNFHPYIKILAQMQFTPQDFQYTSQIIRLANHTLKNEDFANRLENNIKSIAESEVSIESEEALIIEHLASIYSSTFSTLPWRIQVHGHKEFLQNDKIAQHIRCSLFAGIRFAVTWRQCGGSHWDFAWRKDGIAKAASMALEGNIA